MLRPVPLDVVRSGALDEGVEVGAGDVPTGTSGAGVGGGVFGPGGLLLLLPDEKHMGLARRNAQTATSAGDGTRGVDTEGGAASSLRSHEVAFGVGGLIEGGGLRGLRGRRRGRCRGLRFARLAEAHEGHL